MIVDFCRVTNIETGKQGKEFNIEPAKIGSGLLGPTTRRPFGTMTPLDKITQRDGAVPYSDQ